MLRHFLLALALVLSASPLLAQTYRWPCNDSLDPLLSILVEWSAECDSSLDYGFVVSVTGAGLSVAYDPATGLTMAPRQKLLWPGNAFIALDSTYVPLIPRNWNEAESLLVQGMDSRTRQLLYGPEPVVLTGVDTSFGPPWFFVSMCDSAGAISAIWDRSDFLRTWWRWADLPGANSIWPMPQATTTRLGRRVVHACMRHLVLAARPDSLGKQHFGLSALAAAQLYLDLPPGSPKALRQMAGLRAAAADFLERAVDLWPPAKREPVRLASFFLQKDSEAWLTLAAVSGTWTSYDAGQRAEWLVRLADWETKAAVALDQIVSKAE